MSAIEASRELLIYSCLCKSFIRRATNPGQKEQARLAVLNRQMMVARSRQLLSLERLKGQCGVITEHPASAAFAGAVAQKAAEEQQRRVAQQEKFLAEASAAGGEQGASSPAALLETAIAILQELAEPLAGCDKWLALTQIAALEASRDPEGSDALFREAVDGIKALLPLDRLTYVRTLIKMAEIIVKYNRSMAEEICQSALGLFVFLPEEERIRSRLSIALLKAEASPDQALQMIESIDDDSYLKSEALCELVKIQAMTDFAKAETIAAQIHTHDPHIHWVVLAQQYLAVEEAQQGRSIHALNRVAAMAQGRLARLVQGTDIRLVNFQTAAYCRIAETVSETNSQSAIEVLALALEGVRKPSTGVHGKVVNFCEIFKTLLAFDREAAVQTLAEAFQYHTDSYHKDSTMLLNGVPVLAGAQALLDPDEAVKTAHQLKGSANPNYYPQALLNIILGKLNRIRQKPFEW